MKTVKVIFLTKLAYTKNKTKRLKIFFRSNISFNFQEVL